MNRRSFLLGAALVPFGFAARGQASAWPAKSVHLIVPYAAGGPTDVAARLVAEALSRILPQRVVVENITGAGTVVGTGRVAAARDGHTFLVATVAHAVNAVLYANLPFDTAKAFSDVALIGTVPQIVLLNKDVDAASLPALLDLARKRPNGLTYGSAGVGSAQHLAAELLRSMGQVNLVHVPYRGSGPAVTDLIGGRLDLVIDSAATALQYIKSGSARALAVTTRERLKALPDVPTVAETLAGYEAYTWNAILAPAASTPDAVAVMNAAVNKALAEPAVAARLSELGIAVAISSPEQTKAFVAGEMAKWQPLLRSAGIAPAQL